MIHLRGASFVYQAPDGEVEALRRVDMDIAPGEFCSVVGPSGCGKSTLLSVISGLEKLTSGTVEVDGAPVCGPSEKIGFMPQRDQLFPWRTIRDNVTLGLSITGKRTPEALAYADTLLRRYGLWDFAQKRPSQLSGGMRQRCALIRTMATNPKILLLDEPSMGLSPTMVKEIFDTIRRTSETGVTIMLVEQNANMALKLSQRAYVIESGVIVQSGDSQELLRSDEVRKAYLGEE